jgi:hypothetical protein
MTSRCSIGFSSNIAGSSFPVVVPPVAIPLFVDRSFAFFGGVFLNRGSSVVVPDGGDPLWWRLWGIREKALAEAEWISAEARATAESLVHF